MSRPAGEIWEHDDLLQDEEPLLVMTLGLDCHVLVLADSLFPRDVGMLHEYYLEDEMKTTWSRIA